MIAVMSVVVAAASCVDHNPRLTALVVSADNRNICVSVTDSSYKSFDGCYPIDPKAQPVKAGDCISAWFPAPGRAPLSHLKILTGVCG